MTSCTITPYGLAFPDYMQNDLEFSTMSYSIDVFFFFDIIINFFSAYVDKHEKIIDNQK